VLLFRLSQGKRLFAALLLLTMGLSASAQMIGDSDRDTDTPFDITADTVEYESDRDVYIARGNVVITQPGRSLTADWVAFSSETRQGIATGNVVVAEAEDLLYADVLSFEIDTLNGIVFDGFIDARGSGFEMTGETIYRKGEETYTFDEGTFTTCRCPEEGREPWQISAKTADIEVGGYATTRNTSFDILGFPVMWLPWMRYPIKTDRETGFLLPEFSATGRSGTRIGLPFFWAARRNLNVTVTPTYLFKRGFKPSIDLEYVFGEHSFGSLYGTIIYDQDIDPDSFETPFDQLRWATEWVHDHHLPRGWRGKVDATFFSDNQFPLDFYEFSYYKRLRYVQSRAFVEKRFGAGQRYGFHGGVWWADDLQNPDNQDRDEFLLNRLPTLQLSGMPQPLPGFLRRLQASFNVDYTNFHSRERAEDIYPSATVVGDDVFLDTGIDAIPDGQEFNEDGYIVTLDGDVITRDGTVLTADEFLAAFPPDAELPVLDPDGHLDNWPPGPEKDGEFQEGEPLGDRGHRVVLNPRIAIPFRVADMVEVLPEIGYHGTFYDTEAQSASMRNLFTAMLDARIRTRREFELPFGLGPAAHVMEPRFVYTGVTDASQEGNPLFVPTAAQPQDRVRQFELFNLTRNPSDRIDSVNAITVGLGNRVFVPGEEGQPPRLFADVSLSTQYDFARDDHAKLYLEGSSNPFDNVRVRFNLGWDFDEMEFSETLLEARYWTEEGHDLAFSYRYLRDIPLFFESFRFSGEENRYEEFEEGLFKINQLTLRGRWAINRNWAITYGLRYSFESEIFLTNRGGVEYISKCRCWAIRLEVGGDRSGGAFFNVQYTLIGLGDDDVRPFAGGGFFGSGGSRRDPLSGAQN
jgi:lipopolysaccharide assembly outer membrane protein LptD (OstA)